MRRTATALLALSAVAGLSGCGSSDVASDTGTRPPASMTPNSPTNTGGTGSTSPTETASATVPPSDGALAAGVYLTLAEYKNQLAARERTKVVYHFDASWCPDCRATEKAIRADGVPAGLTIVKVDFDEETDLRKQYGVTVQHTFVQVAPGGKQLAKWSGTRTPADIEAKTV